MSKIIKRHNKEFFSVDDSWQILTLPEKATSAKSSLVPANTNLTQVIDPTKNIASSSENVIIPDGQLIFPLALWQARSQEIIEREQSFGILLEPQDDPGTIALDLQKYQAKIALVAVEFPKFTDGRGFSTAYLLRERYAYKGELRAVGDVLIDQLLYMARVGFDAFALRADKSIASAIAAFDMFSEHYQSSIDQPLPIFRRQR